LKLGKRRLLLGLKEFEIPEWVKDILDKLGSIEGERTEGDEAEKVRGGTYPDRSGEESDEEPKPFDGEVPPNDRREGKGHEAIEPKPYIELEEKVKPLVQELINELAWEEKPKKYEAAERGGRLSIREYLRDKNRPFLAEEDRGKAPPTLALKVIVDHSTSLSMRPVSTISTPTTSMAFPSIPQAVALWARGRLEGVGPQGWGIKRGRTKHRDRSLCLRQWTR